MWFSYKNIVNNFQSVIGDTFVSKVQGGQNKSQGGAKHPLAPPQIHLCLHNLEVLLNLNGTFSRDNYGEWVGRCYNNTCLHNKQSACICGFASGLQISKIYAGKEQLGQFYFLCVKKAVLYKLVWLDTITWQWPQLQALLLIPT